MNTSKLQAFATDARRQLMNAVRARLDAALVPNSDAQVDDPRAFAFLQREIERAGGGVEGRKHVVERYAYRWFNRIIAFRYMDVHGFTGTPVVDSILASSCGRQLSRCGNTRRSPLTSNATITTSVAPVSNKIPGNRLTHLSLSAFVTQRTASYIITTSNCSWL